MIFSAAVEDFTRLCFLLP